MPARRTNRSIYYIRTRTMCRSICYCCCPSIVITIRIYITISSSHISYWTISIVVIIAWHSMSITSVIQAIGSSRTRKVFRLRISQPTKYPTKTLAKTIIAPVRLSRIVVQSQVFYHPVIPICQLSYCIYLIIPHISQRSNITTRLTSQSIP